MKSFIKYAVAAIIAVLLVCGALAAEPGDYGYYDADGDGTVDVFDVISILKDTLGSDGDASILRVLRTLKASVSNEQVKFYISEFDYENQTVTLKENDEDGFKMSFAQLGLDQNPFASFYEEGFVTLTVPSPAKEFFAEYDNTKVYASLFESRYDTNVYEKTVGDGDDAPIVYNGTVMIHANVFKDVFEGEVAWDPNTKTARFFTFDNSLEMTLDSTVALVNGVETEVDAPMITYNNRTYISVDVIASVFDAKYVFDGEAQTLTLAKQFYPTVWMDDVSGKAGEEVSVSVYIKHNPGIAGFEFKIPYDSSVMTYISGTAISNGCYTAASVTEGANPVKVVMANLSLKNVSGDIGVVTVKFKLAEDVESGENIILNIEGVKGYDKNILALKTSVMNGKIVVE